MILHAPRSINREIPARSCAHAVLLRICAQRKLAHQFGPAIGVIRVVRAFCEIFREVKFFFYIRLKEVWIHAAFRDDANTTFFLLSHAELPRKRGRRGKNWKPVPPDEDRHNRGPPMINSGQMKYRIYALHRRACDARFAQVRVDKLDLSGGKVFLDIVAMPAGQVIDDADFRAACEKVIRKSRADEGGPSRYQYKLSAPKCFRSRHAFTAPSMIFTNFCNSLTLS